MFGTGFLLGGVDSLIGDAHYSSVATAAAIGTFSCTDSDYNYYYEEISWLEAGCNLTKAAIAFGVLSGYSVYESFTYKLRLAWIVSFALVSRRLHLANSRPPWREHQDPDDPPVFRMRNVDPETASPETPVVQYLAPVFNPPSRYPHYPPSPPSSVRVPHLFGSPDQPTTPQPVYNPEIHGVNPEYPNKPRKDHF